ncbi:putative spermidine/putrescine transport system substrate-binding protein [Dongia mobilis]|uniref:Putative spermidine/putrescine transport system substrate-binding protein n=1 Tax=Dongia mobilis TaxID=578943 RepID=A0A4R6WS92_9PROT|nr:extracellular solute-binding protein [Dongia mobilis]TDQ84465.1 putative spermidine/putrescine transport system substrate-binding protein [Dongia mobilis]
MPLSPFLSDAIDLARRQGWSRRRFLAAIGTGVAASSLPYSAAAQAKELVFASWGGDEIKSLTQAFARSYSAETGTPVLFDGTGPAEGAIRAMVDSGNVAWDVCDADGFTAIRLGQSGHLSAVDYRTVDAGGIMPPFNFSHGACGYTYSYVLAFDSERFAARPPMTWRDFFDTRAFPGGRAVYRWMNGGFEAAMMAEGDGLTNPYPIDIGRAVTRLARLKPLLQLWEGGDQVEQMFRDKTISMACIWHTRATALARESEGKIAFTWAGGILYPGCWVVPKGNPGGNDAFRLIAHMQDPGRQIEFARLRGVGPANPAATAAMPQRLRDYDPTQPGNLAQQVVADSHWWAEHFDKARTDFNDMLERN